MACQVLLEVKIVDGFADQLGSTAPTGKQCLYYSEEDLGDAVYRI
ncbi:MAG: hypothetical protein O3C28_16295 [Proteobacteria bacterium]|nr:hypothetical protein [Pseudomonadota bacterium]